MVKYQKIRKQLMDFIPFNEQEEQDKQAFLTLIDIFDNALTRQNTFGHLTCSAFVVNENLTKTLLVKHNILGGYIYPGGHADGESNFLSVAIREVKEETNLDAFPLFDKIFSIQTAPVKGHVKKGKYISAHVHYDVIYVLMVKNSDMDKIKIAEG